VLLQLRTRKFSVNKLRCEKDNLNVSIPRNAEAHQAMAAFTYLFLGAGGGTKSVLNFLHQQRILLPA